MQNSKSYVWKLLSLAGITENGDKPYDIKVHNDLFYDKVLTQGSLGLAEAYMDDWWDCERLDEFFFRILQAKLEEHIRSDWKMKIRDIRLIVLNLQSRSGSRKVVRQHYDLSPKLYESFLDPYNQYTCGYFKNSDDLNKAQELKLDLICRKLGISSRDKVLDIGCGWGGFAKYAAEHYGCHVTGITISGEQEKYAREYTRGLSVEILKQDYRDLRGEEVFDKVLVCGMIEHVGFKNYRTFMERVHHSLTKDGLFLLQTIGGNESVKTTDPWLDKYIFPNSMLPSIAQLAKAAEHLFVVEDWHSFGPVHYDKTLMAWHRNFNEHWSSIEHEYDKRFHRMWNYYLLSFAGAFRARKHQLWQVVFSKNGVAGGYQAIR